MKISYAITVYNELFEIQRLLPYLIELKREEDEIIILWDNKGPKEVCDYVFQYERKNVKVFKDTFENHFADWKNKLNRLCTGDWIFQIDADEYPHSSLIENLPFILEHNSESDIFLVPRVNTLTPAVNADYIKKWGWKMNEKGWIQWPDHQWRIYKNIASIYWKNKLHEVLEGYKNYANLPELEEYALYHPKSLERQEKQNSYYNTL